MSSSTTKKAIQFINRKGVLLVFPLKNKKEPQSLWSCLHPRSEMKWDWDVTGDDRVVRLWHMMKELSSSGEVVYSKWFQNRATFFSKECFTALLSYYKHRFDLKSGLLPEARSILYYLENDSPLSTKEIKELTELRGKLYEGLYSKSMKQLYQRGLIVGFGEKEDGAFPSSLMGSTELLFEKLVRNARTLKLENAESEISRFFPTGSPIQKHLQRVEKSLKANAE